MGVSRRQHLKFKLPWSIGAAAFTLLSGIIYRRVISICWKSSSQLQGKMSIEPYDLRTCGNSRAQRKAGRDNFILQFYLAIHAYCQAWKWHTSSSHVMASSFCLLATAGTLFDLQRTSKKEGRRDRGIIQVEQVISLFRYLLHFAKESTVVAGSEACLCVGRCRTAVGRYIAGFVSLHESLCGGVC